MHHLRILSFFQNPKISKKAYFHEFRGYNGRKWGRILMQLFEESHALGRSRERGLVATQLVHFNAGGLTWALCGLSTSRSVSLLTVGFFFMKISHVTRFLNSFIIVNLLPTFLVQCNFPLPPIGSLHISFVLFFSFVYQFQQSARCIRKMGNGHTLPK